MFSLLILTIILSYVYGFSKKVVLTPYLPDYEIPKWVYKEVFSYNKPTTIKEKYKTIDHEYNTIKKLKLPMGILQPYNKY